MERRKWENRCSTPNISPEIHNALLLTGAFLRHVKQTFISRKKTTGPEGQSIEVLKTALGVFFFTALMLSVEKLCCGRRHHHTSKFLWQERGLTPTLGFLTFAQAKLGFIFFFFYCFFVLWMVFASLRFLKNFKACIQRIPKRKNSKTPFNLLVTVLKLTELFKEH